MGKAMFILELPFEFHKRSLTNKQWVDNMLILFNSSFHYSMFVIWTKLCFSCRPWHAYSPAKSCHLGYGCRHRMEHHRAVNFRLRWCSIMNLKIDDQPDCWWILRCSETRVISGEELREERSWRTGLSPRAANTAFRTVPEGSLYW